MAADPAITGAKVTSTKLVQRYEGGKEPEKKSPDAGLEVSGASSCFSEGAPYAELTIGAPSVPFGDSDGAHHCG